MPVALLAGTQRNKKVSQWHQYCNVKLAQAIPQWLLGAFAMPSREIPDAWSVRAAWLVIVATVVRLAISNTELGDGEAYYYTWSRFLDWSYYDHPPLLAWLVWLTTRFARAEVMVRLGPVLSSAVLGVLIYRLTARLFTPRAAFFALAVITALPAFVLNSFAVNPETPLTAIWVAFLYLLETMRTRDEPWRPILAGALIGVAFLAKYTGVLLVPVTFVYIVMAPVARRWLGRPSFYLGGLAALVVSLPVILWNELHAWPSIQLHFFERAAPLTGAALGENVLKVLRGQLFAYSPVIFPLLVAALVISVRRGRRDDRFRFLAHMSWPVLLFFFVAMIRVRDSEDHWTMVGYIPLSIAAGAWLDELFPKTAFVKWYLRVSLGLSAAFFTLILVHIHTSAILRMVPESAYDGSSDITNEFIGWDRVRAAVRDVRAKLPGDAVLAAGHYALCAHVMRAVDDDPNVYCPSVRRSEYDFLGRHDLPPGKTVIFLNNEPHPDLPGPLLPEYHCTQAQKVPIQRGGRTVRNFGVFVCTPPS